MHSSGLRRDHRKKTGMGGFPSLVSRPPTFLHCLGLHCMKLFVFLHLIVIYFIPNTGLHVNVSVFMCLIQFCLCSSICFQLLLTFFSCDSKTSAFPQQQTLMRQELWLNNGFHLPQDRTARSPPSPSAQSKAQTHIPPAQPSNYHQNLCCLANFPVSYLSINMTITIRA